MEPNEISFDLQILSTKEALEINAGESAWYWVAYGVGVVGRTAVAVGDAMVKYADEHPLECFMA